MSDSFSFENFVLVQKLLHAEILYGHTNSISLTRSIIFGGIMPNLMLWYLLKTKFKITFLRPFYICTGYIEIDPVCPSVSRQCS